MEDITKTVKTLEETGLMIKCVSETVEYEAKEQKSGFLCYQNEPRFHGVYTKNNLPKMKDEIYVTNFDTYIQ